VILVWVTSLILLCASLVVHLEKLAALHMLEIKTIENAQNQFILAEKSILECESNLTNLSLLSENNCLIQSSGKNQWLISSIQKPMIQVHVHVDEKSGAVSRLNWRQVFD
jgi:hypothetical protein